MFYKALVCLLPCLAVCNSALPASSEQSYQYVPSAVTNPVTDSADKLNDKEILFLKSHGPTYWQAADQDTLRQVLFVHRHGDRTPIEFRPRDNLANEPFWQLHGMSQLTNRGKARLYALGKIIRQRYNKFLAGSVNKSSRKSRSSGSLRCIESAQVFLASFLGLDTPNSDDAEELIWNSSDNDQVLSHTWQPASISTFASMYDGMLNVGAKCKNLNKEYAALDSSEEFKSILNEFDHEKRVLDREYGFVLDKYFKWNWASSQLEVEHSYFGLKMKPAILNVHLRIQQAGDRTMKLSQTRPLMKRFRAGLLVNDMIENMVAMSEDSKSPFNKKFNHYSAHDMNLVFLMGIFNNIDKMHHRPDYAANMIIELHEDGGEWFIKLFYMSHVPTRPMELHIEACERGHEQNRCTLSKFAELMEPYRVASWWDWMKECGNSVEGMNPYAQNL